MKPYELNVEDEDKDVAGELSPEQPNHGLASRLFFLDKLENQSLHHQEEATQSED